PDGPGRSVALFPDDDLRTAADLLIFRLVDLLTVDEEHDVCILLDRTRFAKVGKLRPVAVLGAGLGRARELREGDDRDPELFGEPLERAADVGDLELARFVAAPTAHELEVVDNQDVEPLLRLQP